MSDAAYVSADPRFRALIQPSARLECIATGFRWAEGPVWLPRSFASCMSTTRNFTPLSLTAKRTQRFDSSDRAWRRRASPL